MRAGQLRDSIRVERRGEDSTDGWGNPVSGDFAELIAAQPARLIPMGGDEQVRADRLTGSVKYEVTLRWSSANAGIRADDRFVLARASAGLASATVLNVRHEGVDPTEKRRELRFVCETGVAT
jgi:head-tail adaptor